MTVNVRASWRRTVQVRPYETEELVLAVEGEYALAAEIGGTVPANQVSREQAEHESMSIAAILAESLAEQGDSLIAARAEAREPKKPDPPQEPVGPDPWLTGRT